MQYVTQEYVCMKLSVYDKNNQCFKLKIGISKTQSHDIREVEKSYVGVIFK